MNEQLEKNDKRVRYKHIYTIRKLYTVIVTHDGKRNSIIIDKIRGNVARFPM